MTSGEGQLLLLAQVDDTSGEVLAQVTEELLAAGAASVQLLAAIGKHGRPAQILLVDAPSTVEDEIALILVTELGVWGYHALETRHRHAMIQEERRALVVLLDGQRLELEVGCKWIGLGDRPVRVKAEHRDLLVVQAALRARGHKLPLAMLRSRVEEEAWQRPRGEVLELRL